MKKDFGKLNRAMNPQCIAVVGDKGQWLGYLNAYKGKLYSVQIDPELIKKIEAMGVKNYLSLLDVPEPVDLVIVATPRNVTPRILEDCIKKDVAAAHFFTAGFGESGTEEGRRLEKVIVERARQANFHLIGPNCMGVFNPKLGVRFAPNQYVDVVGSVGAISQSGVNLGMFINQGRLHGVEINKGISFGNGLILDSADFIEYFGNDPDIKVIGMYLEGVRDGKRFFSVLREVASRKPVVIWKSGRTNDSGRATASHSGSLAIPQTIWESVVRQCGAVSVANLDELIDVVKAFEFLPPVHGDRVGLVAGSGGRAVAITDAFADAGLRVPMLSQKSLDELATFFNLVGGSHRNPIDLGWGQTEHVRIMKIMEKDTEIDNLVLQWTSAYGPRTEQLKTKLLPALVEMRNQTSKPLMVVLSSLDTAEDVQRSSEVAAEFHKNRIPTFPSSERGARALKTVLDYYRRRDGVSSSN